MYDRRCGVMRAFLLFVFPILLTAAVPSANAQTCPVLSAITPTAAANVSSPVLFQWTADPGATGYHLIIENVASGMEVFNEFPISATNRSVSTKIAELAGAGTAGEREKTPGDDHGFLWRLNAYWRYEQVDGGVLIECESVSLSRSIPLLLRPFVTSTVDRIARESLEKTLRSVKAFLIRP